MMFWPASAKRVTTMMAAMPVVKQYAAQPLSTSARIFCAASRVGLPLRV